MTPRNIYRVHTLVVGSGAAGLNAAVQLVRRGVQDVAILTEGLTMGTSINAGSDKQTYYKLSLCGAEADSPRNMAESYFEGGSMHGDLALVEASLSARAFLNLVNLGVDFPQDEYGQFVGYKTDHDPRQRATSIGPYTSREMCIRLTAEVRRLGIPVYEKRDAIQLVTIGEPGQSRIVGVLSLNEQGELEGYLTENLIFAVGGPGGLYQASVYPPVHSGAIGLALMAGARARSLPESQFGLASTFFRWNVSGTYMQVIPRVISRAADGQSDEQEFLRPYFASAGEMNGMVFLKGYQWPFDARKVIGGSSLVDILVYIERMLHTRRVFLDFRNNPADFSFEQLPTEASEYLRRSGAHQPSPLERLRRMNPAAVELYAQHGIDLASQLLEVAVCAQHNNGGLAGNIWWESTNIAHLFPIGEVNGSHGVSRPGGAALNAGQVGGFRAADYIANRYAGWSLIEDEALTALDLADLKCRQWAAQGQAGGRPWREVMEEVKERMSRAGAHVRSQAVLQAEVSAAWQTVNDILRRGCQGLNPDEQKEVFRTRQLCFAHAVYLDAILFALMSGVGSRGSAIVLDAAGQKVHPDLDDSWKIAPEEPAFRSKVLETVVCADGSVRHEWVERRPIPEADAWFENTWRRYREGEIYKSE